MIDIQKALNGLIGVLERVVIEQQKTNSHLEVMRQQNYFMAQALKEIAESDEDDDQTKNSN